MLEWIGDPCIETLGIPCGSDSPISVVLIFSDESRNDSAYISTLRDASGIRVDASLPLFWYL